MAEESRYRGFSPQQEPIASYGNGGFRFGDLSHRGALLAFPDGMFAWEGVDANGITLESLAPLIARAGGFDLLLLGMGVDMAPLPRTLGEALKGAGLRYELLSTPAAIRTYNILLSESRRVAAAFVAVDPVKARPR